VDVDADVSVIGQFDRARLLFERCVFGGDASALAVAERELDEVEADLCLARGRILHARFLERHEEDPRELPLFERAVGLYRQLGNVPGEGEALLWVGLCYQVVRDDGVAAVPALERSYELAAAVDDKLTLSYAARHLGFADLAADRMEAARWRLEESVRLRREIGFMPGVAAGLLAVAELTAAEGNRSEALALLDQAASVAADSGALGTLRWIEETRADLTRAG
jgi:hypothetical protein